ncbi:MAG: FtsX-like permease family protein [Candidatus Heimdallarchaeota archaeon]
MTQPLFKRLLDHLILVYELVLSNKRLFLPTMVGLIIALTIVSNSSVLIESYSSEIFEEMLDRDNSEGDIRIEGRPGYRGSSLSLVEPLTNYDSYNAHIEMAIGLAGYSDYVIETRWYTRLEHRVISYNSGKESFRYSEILVSSETDFYLETAKILNFTEKGRLPSSSDEIVLIKPMIEDPYQGGFWKNYTLSREVMISIGYGEAIFNKTVTIVGILEYDISQQAETTTNLLTKYFGDLWGDYRFLSTIPLFTDIMTEYEARTDVNDYYSTVVGELDLDHTVLNPYDVTGELNKLKRFLNQLDRSFGEVFFENFVYSELLWNLQSLQGTILMLIVVLILVSLPVIAIALYLVIYSFGLVRRQYQHQIGIIKTRGGTSLQIFYLLLAEIVISTAIATGFGFIASLGLANLVLRSSDFLQFEGNPVPVRATISIVQNLIYWGILFAALLNLARIIRLSRQDIIETQIPMEKRDPLWKRRYLDVSMFLIGTGTWILIMSVIQASISGEEIGPLFIAISPLLALLMIPAPFFMFFGTIMVIARVFPPLMGKISDIIWRMNGGIIAFSIRNIVRHKQAANRAVLLVTLALSFSILSSSLIFSMDESAKLRFYYNEGADITMSYQNTYNRSLSLAVQKNVSHITGFSTVLKAGYQRFGSLYERYEFVFVDPHTYAKAAFIHPSFRFSSPLNVFMDELADNRTILLHERNLDSAGTSIGEDFPIRFTNSSTTEIISLKVGGTFEYWPSLYPQPWNDPSEHYWIIGSVGLFNSLNDSNYLSNIDVKDLAKIDSDTNLESTIRQITNITKITPTAPGLLFKDYKSNFGRKFSISVLNTDLIVCMVVAAVGIVMFAFFTYIERGKEVGVERALGMTQIQTAQSFLVEAIMILAFGATIGTISGMYFVSMFLIVTQLGQTIPPSVVAYPIPVILGILIGILIAAGIGTVIPAYLSTKKDISRVLKVD